MKKITSILISVCLMLTVIGPSVFAYESTTISVSNIMLEDETYLVTLKGTCEPDSRITIMVVTQAEKNYVAFEQCMANNSGVFTKTFYIEFAGKYTAIINSSKSNIRATADFELYSKTQLDDVVGQFKSATDITTMNNYISQYGDMFGLDTRFYNDDSKDAVALEMLKLKNLLTKENIAVKFDEANLRAYIYTLSTNLDAVIEYYDSFTSIVSSPVGMYEDYKAMDDIAKAQVCTVAFETPVTELSDLCEKFYMAIVAVKVKNDLNDEMDIFLTKYSDYLGIEGYADVVVVKRTQLLNALKTSKIPDNTEEFAKLYTALVSKIESDNTQKPSGGGGGGGGGASGGTGPIITDPTRFEPTESNDKSAVDIIPAVQFDDLDGYSWAKAAITYLADKGVVNGKAEGVFAPADSITREEYAKILVLTYGLYNEDASCSFTDVSADRWSYKYIASIYGHGVVTGYPDGSFEPSKPITREEMAVMLYRVMSKQLKVEPMTEVKISINDYDEVSEFAKNSVATLNYNKIISGDNIGNFNPKNNATRAEICQMIYNSVIKEGGRN